MLLQSSWLFPVFANNQSGQSPIDPLKLCSLSLNLLERSPRHYGPMQVDFFLFRYYYMTHEYSQNTSQVFLYASKLLTTIIGKAIPFSNYLTGILWNGLHQFFFYLTFYRTSVCLFGWNHSLSPMCIILSDSTAYYYCLISWMNGLNS